MGTCFSKRRQEFKHTNSYVCNSQDYLDSKKDNGEIGHVDPHFGQHYQEGFKSKPNQKNSKLLTVVEQAQCEKESCSVSVNNNFESIPVKSQAFRNSNNDRQISNQSIVEQVDINNPEFIDKFGRPSPILELDEKSLYGIRNLSEKWISQIKKSSITPEEIRTNPKALIDVITAFEAEISYQQSIFPQKLITSLQYANHIEGVEFIQQNPNNKWEFTQQLGKGFDCKVYKAIEKVSSSQARVLAVRIFDINKKHTTIEKIKKEIATIKLCSSRNIIDYEFSYMHQNKIYMFVNYMNGGSITLFLKNTKSKLPEELIAYLLKQILIGLKAIHKNHQIHRDIKSDNILINEFAQIKITDFGHAIQLTPNNNSPKEAVGTPAWMAPQLIKREVYNQSVDIWSLGILALELALGQPPYLKMNQLKAMYEILSKPPPKLPDSFSQQFRKFVSNCLQKNPQDRLNTQQLLQTPFIKSINEGIKQKIKLKGLIKQYCSKP